MNLDFKRDPEGGWYDRTVHLVDDEGYVVEEFGKNPTLDELREAEHRHGVRINLWQQGLVCKECKNQITGRFSADQHSNLVCWDCAMEAQAQDQGGLRINVDPTKTVLSQSKLNKKSLCDYVINVATGCRHGCRFCYVPSTPAVDNREDMLAEKVDVGDPQADWGRYLLYRDDLPERVHQGLQTTDFSEWKSTRRGRGVVMLSSGTDCYQDRRAAQITRGVVQELTEHQIPVRILTRSPNFVRDIDLFKEAGDYVTVGTSIPSFDTALVKALEPQAPPPMARWEALDKLFRANVRRFVSFSPTYPTMSYNDIHDALSWFSAINPEVVFHEPLNPRGENFDMCIEATKEAGYKDVATRLESIQQNDSWVEYSIKHIRMVHEAAETFDNLTVHTWPDMNLIKHTQGEIHQELKQMYKSVSPEKFPKVTE